MHSTSSRALPRFRWRFLPLADAAAPANGYHPLVPAILAQRGITHPDDVAAFLAPSDVADNPFLLAGMPEAVGRLRQAILQGETIAVFGDYDADGVAGTAILCEALAGLGGVVTSFIPHRERDGYGLNQAAIAALAAKGASLLVTVDCGIRSPAEVDAAKALGLDVIVTDHHALPELVPNAVAVINPKRPDCPSGLVELSGAGLAFKLAQALLRAESRQPLGVVAAAEPEDYAAREAALLDLAAIGTVADVVPLVRANRILVQMGLLELRKGRRPGLAALATRSRLDLGKASAESIGFVLAPRINAAGRMGDASRALSLLLAKAPDEATLLAGELDNANEARREATAEAMRLAEAAVGSREGDAAAFLLFASPDLPLGVMGLVAGRLTEKHYRPAAAVRLDGELARGSARSIPEFDVTAALDQVAHLLVKHGGHARAAGFTVRVERLEELQAALLAAAESQLSDRDLRGELAICASLMPADITWELYHGLQALEPFGEGNPKPLLHLARARIGAPRIVGERHLRFSVITPNGPIDAIAFGHGPRFAAASRHVQLDRADLVFRLESNSWNGGAPRLEMVVEDLVEVG